MVKVICAQCKDCGFTASPDYVRCPCGGQLVVIGENKEEKKADEHESTSYFA